MLYIHTFSHRDGNLTKVFLEVWTEKLDSTKLAEARRVGDADRLWEVMGDAAADLFLNPHFAGNAIASAYLAKKLVVKMLKEGYERGYVDGQAEANRLKEQHE